MAVHEVAPTRRQIETGALHVSAIITLLGENELSRSGDVMQSTVKGPTGAKVRLQHSPLIALVSSSLVGWRGSHACCRMAWAMVVTRLIRRMLSARFLR